VRAEYERFNAAGENPSLLSAGITWSFFQYIMMLAVAAKAGVERGA
jgi:hypothetical protein